MKAGEFWIMMLASQSLAIAITLISRGSGDIPMMATGVGFVVLAVVTLRWRRQ